MENEKPKFYVEELDEIRKIAEELFQFNINPKADNKELFMLKVDSAILHLQRKIQFKQLHLQKDAVIFMDHLQSELAQVSEDCHNFLITEKKVKSPSEIKVYLDILIASINTLFEFLMEFYDYCFNFQMAVPIRFKHKADSILIKTWDKLILSLKENEIEDRLIDILANYYLELKSNKKPNFHELDFAFKMISALNKIDFKRTSEIEINLSTLFCYYNFNYPPLMQFYINSMQRDYDKIESYREEYFSITVELRTLKQLIIKRDIGYDPNTNNFRDSLCHVLEDELICIKKLMNLNKKLFEGNGAKFLLQKFYFRITISMEQFLFIFRLMIDKGIVQVKRKADLYEFIHSHVGTAKKDNLSIGNMQNTYAENNRVTAIKVRALLQTMINHIDEKYLSFCCIILIM